MRSENEGQSVAYLCDVLDKEMRENQQDLRKDSQTSRRETEGRYPGSQGKKVSGAGTFVNRPRSSDSGI